MSATSKRPLEVAALLNGDADPSAKRQRTSPNPQDLSHQLSSTTGLGTAITALPYPQLRYLVLDHAAKHAPLRDDILRIYDAKVQEERAKVIDFDHDSKNVWYTLNKKYSKLSGSKQYDMSWDAHESVCSDIKSIGRAATTRASFGTRRNALTTLRKIGKSIAMASDTLGHEVRKQFQSTETFVNVFYEIASSMSDEEKDSVLTMNCDGSTFEEKLEELIGMASGYCIFEGIEDCLAVLRDEEDTDEEEEHNPTEADALYDLGLVDEDHPFVSDDDTEEEEE